MRRKGGDLGPRGNSPGDDSNSHTSSRWKELNIKLSEFAPNNHETLCEMIALIFGEISATPETLLQDFEAISEAKLMAGAHARASAIPVNGVTVAERSSEIDTIFDAAELLRALEISAVELSHYLETDRDEELEALWRTSDGRFYVIPRVTPLAKIDGKPFLRRALLHYRVLPTQIDNFRVRLHRSTLASNAAVAAADRSGSQRKFGAALFPGLKVEMAQPVEGTFSIVRLGGFDASTCIRDHLRSGRDAGCRSIVWGELTMPQESVAILARELRGAALDGPCAFRYFVAGSWHREVDGALRNASEILDGHGEPLFTVYKWAKFKIGTLQEAIVPGDEVHVLVDEDEVMVVAICRDFLQSTTDVPYRNVNADIAVVPSMIPTIEDEATMKGHAETANVMRVRFGTRTMVVAQPAEPGPDAAVGKVLGFPSKPTTQNSEAVEGAWHVCVLESR